MDDHLTRARITVDKQHFEILVHPDNALRFKMGKTEKISDILVINTIFTDYKKGLRASEKQLRDSFKITDVNGIAEIILNRGELLLTTAQRRRLVEEKKKQIVTYLSRHCVDPRTGFPHPPLRIEQAMKQIRLVIDPLKSGEAQSEMVIEALRPIIPLKVQKVRMAIKIPAEHVPRVMGAVRNFCSIEKEEWQKNGSWIALTELPAGFQSSLLERLEKITKGNYQVKILK